MDSEVIFYLVILLLLLAFMIFLLWNQNKSERARNRVTPVILQSSHIENSRLKREAQKHVDQEVKSYIPPEIQRLMDLQREYASDNEKWDTIVAMGDIYRRGAFPRFLPNQELALRCYRVAAMCPDGRIAGLSQAKYVECRLEEINIVDRQGVDLPPEFGERVCDMAYTYIANLNRDQNHQSRPKFRNLDANEFPMLQRNQNQRREPDPLNADFLGDFALETQTDIDRGIEAIRNWETLRNGQRAQAHYIDAQNVHDHSVNATVKSNIKQLLRVEGGSSPNSHRQDIRFMNNDKDDILNTIVHQTLLDPDVRANALHVLENLNNNKHSTFGISESEALSLVWKKINETNDKEVQQNLKETLTQQLAESVEHGHIVCSSGKITRIMSTLEGTDQSMNVVKPMWALKEEFGGIATKIRDSPKFNNDNPSDVNNMKNEFRNTIREEYINKLGLNSSIIEPLLLEYEQGFE